ncbi:CDP-diacylglycerol--glycerol-3-phosphate 3-phosphatidyltransferase [Bifidobacterium bombi]|uniref:CDP-diacylglycerol--glycerol-3-phosphate 3-phosphatidyltransferase n=1 Tax=Bifidobacterium bombi DSM 19703 TaxID=1341695 RepID=A0A080N2V8_9BIFI|nr:CDP-diacylglycerol--glycerol-3-phosphate 3-phosphatidyltransferase [Bifidobacterium bombi]KFF31393.1 CDP-diacylglycerol--glycerol-3-phosphate 3-phosphatidyltransferase [Bifidobacterium bombi DSM 19703]
MKQQDERHSLLKGWNSPPNLVTYTRILLVLVFVGLDLSAGKWGGGSVSRRFWAAVLFIVAASTDKLDGWMARKYNQITELGKLMDPIADKLLICSTLVVASVFHELSWWVTALFLVREIGITLMRFFVIDAGGTVIAASKAGKYKTFAECIGLGMLLMPMWALAPGRPLPGILPHLGAGAPLWWSTYYWATYVVIGLALVLCLYSGCTYVYAVATSRGSARD